MDSIVLFYRIERLILCDIFTENSTQRLGCGEESECTNTIPNKSLFRCFLSLESNIWF